MIKVRGLNSLLEEIQSKYKTELAAKKKGKIEKMVHNLQENTPVQTGYARDHWKAHEDSITNTADYISDLNHGTSEQAPSYFVEKTLLKEVGVTPNGTIVRSN